VTPIEALEAGRKILDPILGPPGFVFAHTANGDSSGGCFAAGEYVRESRRLELHFRYSLGLVTYHIDSFSASHEAYMRELLGNAKLNQYPGFSDDPVDGFRHLAHDLAIYGQDFLFGTGDELIRASLQEAKEQQARQKIDMADAVGDTQKREDARQLFKKSEYREVIKKLQSLSHPELMEESEKKMLEIAKRKLKQASPTN
jgi:hypothetical protein